MLTVTLKKPPNQQFGEVYALISRSGQQLHFWPAMVQQQ
jgi:hypothetical protein